MLNFKVKLVERSAIYTEILKEGNKKEVSAQEMYTNMQQNSVINYADI